MFVYLMIKKISILSLILFFFVSTTGLPVSIHLCKMEETTEAKECLMHSKPVKTFCCDEGNDYDVSIASKNPNCCETKTIDNSIVDEYLIQNPEIKSDLTGTHILLNNGIYNYKSIISRFFGIMDISPPMVIGNHLYLIDSSFLI